MKYRFISVFILTSITFSQDFEAYKQQDKAQFKAYKAEFDNLIDYLDRESSEFKKTLNEIKNIWGDRKISTPKEWVGYSKDKNIRISLNFDKNEGVLQISPQKGLNGDDNLVRNFVEEIDAKLKDSKNLISNNIDIEKIPSLSNKDIEIQIIKNQRIEIKLPFKKGAFNKRVQQVLPFVKKYSTRYNLDPRRVLAQIHAESAFNPRAISTANAYGLMQLVPKFGGKEAYSHIQKENKIPQISTLFDPEKNIELGCTYIHILNTKYFSKINTKESLEYLTISAYNTGPGNVYKSFLFKGDDQKFNVMNKMSPNELYQHLISTLPYQETQNYLKTVIQKKSLYTKI